MEEVEAEDLGAVQKRELEKIKERVVASLDDFGRLGLPASQQNFDLLKQRCEALTVSVRSSIRQETGQGALLFPIRVGR